MAEDNGVDDPWVEDVTVRKMTDTDLVENRTESLLVVNKEGDTYRLAYALSEQIGLDVSATVDRAIRVYLAYLIDSREIRKVRSEYDVRYLIPPENWVEEHKNRFLQRDIHTADYEIRESEVPRKFHVAIPPTVKEMVQDVKEGDRLPEVDEFSEFAIEATQFLAGYEGNPALAEPMGLTALCKTKGRRHLLEHFLLEADSEKEYYKSNLADEAQLSRQTVYDNIDELVAFGIVEKDGKRYQVNQSSEIIQLLYRVNEQLVENYRDAE